MTELGTIGKIMKALDLSKEAKVGVNFDYFQALELRGYIKSLEEELGLIQKESKKDYDELKIPEAPDTPQIAPVTGRGNIFVNLFYWIISLFS